MKRNSLSGVTWKAGDVQMSDAWKAGALMMMMMTLTVLVVYDQDVMHKYLLFAYISHIYIYTYHMSLYVRNVIESS
jgi:hypothetical protein